MLVNRQSLSYSTILVSAIINVRDSTVIISTTFLNISSLNMLQEIVTEGSKIPVGRFVKFSASELTKM